MDLLYPTIGTLIVFSQLAEAIIMVYRGPPFWLP